MPEAPSNTPVFTVCTESEPIVIRIDGRASVKNCAGLRAFFHELPKKGRLHFVVDFQKCTSMDSTFLGVLAATGIALKKMQPAGSLVLSRLGERNLELVKNLGLHRLLVVDDSPVRECCETGGTVVPAVPLNILDSARLVNEAHRSLVEVDAQNADKFKDVLYFTAKTIEEGEAGLK